MTRPSTSPAEKRVGSENGSPFLSALETSLSPLRVLHLNSLLTGGGTDDQCVKLAAGLDRLGQKVWLAGPAGREFAPVVKRLGRAFSGYRGQERTTSIRSARGADDPARANSNRA